MQQKEKKINICTECKIPTRKYRKFFGAWICQKCYKEHDLITIEKANENNYKLF